MLTLSFPLPRGKNEAHTRWLVTELLAGFPKRLVRSFEIDQAEGDLRVTFELPPEERFEALIHFLTLLGEVEYPVAKASPLPRFPPDHAAWREKYGIGG